MATTGNIQEDTNEEGAGAHSLGGSAYGPRTPRMGHSIA
jgi:hypothetical protein